MGDTEVAGSPPEPQEIVADEAKKSPEEVRVEPQPEAAGEKMNDVDTSSAVQTKDLEVETESKSEEREKSEETEEETKSSDVEEDESSDEEDKKWKVGAEAAAAAMRRHTIGLLQLASGKKEETEEDQKRREEKEQRKKKKKEAKEERRLKEKEERKEKKEERKKEKKERKEERKKDKGFRKLLEDMKPNAPSTSPIRRSTLSTPTRTSLEKEREKEKEREQREKESLDPSKEKTPELRAANSSPNIPVMKKNHSRKNSMLKEIKASPKKLLHLRSSGDLHAGAGSTTTPPSSPSQGDLANSEGGTPKLKKWKLVSNQEKEILAGGASPAKETLELRYQRMSKAGQFVPMVNPGNAENDEGTTSDSGDGESSEDFPPDATNNISLNEDDQPRSAPSTPLKQRRPSRLPPQPPNSSSPSTMRKNGDTENNTAEVPAEGTATPAITPESNGTTDSGDNVPTTTPAQPAQITEFAVGPYHIGLKSVKDSGKSPTTPPKHHTHSPRNT